MLSTSRRFLFIHVPKTAGNSIQDALRGHSDDNIVALSPQHDGVERFEIRSSEYGTVKHSTFADYEREYGPHMMDALFKFTCVRNPWDRCMSHYFSPHKGAVQWDMEKFEAFVKAGVRPLRHYLCKGSEPLASIAQNLNFIVRYETLRADFKTACEKIGLPGVDLPHRNSSPQANHRRFYDATTVAQVRALFAEEIEYFGYSF